jgi:hypothetical protein
MLTVLTQNAEPSGGKELAVAGFGLSRAYSENRKGIGEELAPRRSAR